MRPLDTAPARDALFEQFARIGHALSSPKRIELLDLLAQAEKRVEVLARQARVSVKNASAHLRVLREARLVETRREGQCVHYRLADERVVRLVRDLMALARDRLAEVDRIVRTLFVPPGAPEPVTMAELRRRLRRGDVVLLDVRPRDEYAAGHIAGAVSAPLDDLARVVAALPRRAEIVAYCRGPYCVLATEAASRLRRQGRTVRRLEVGFPEWRAAGLPVAAGA